MKQPKKLGKKYQKSAKKMQKRSIFRVFQGFIRIFFAGDQYF